VANARTVTSDRGASRHRDITDTAPTPGADRPARDNGYSARDVHLAGDSLHRWRALKLQCGDARSQFGRA
jgi:hypothetical protein